MATNSGIEYVNHSLGFWKGCTPVSDGCDECYARREMRRYGLDPFKVVRTSRNTWRQPLVKERKTGQYKWKSGDMVFVCPWSDFFHKDADQWRTEAWDLMRKRPDLIWVIVTKRIERAAHWIPINWEPHNRIIVVTTETQKQAEERIPILLMLRSQFDNLTLGVSTEPLLGEIDLRCLIVGPRRRCVYDCLRGQAASESGVIKDNVCGSISWVPIGCESINDRAGRFQDGFVEAAINLVGQCKAAGVPVFVKQVPINGKVSKKMAEWPQELRVQEMPDGKEVAK